jgi:transcriptional regulator with XRE-family HTH domain
VTTVLRQLVRLRIRRKLRQSDVARLMKVSRQQAYNLESMRQGYPSIRTLERYAKAVGAEIVVREKKLR